MSVLGVLRGVGVAQQPEGREEFNGLKRSQIQSHLRRRKIMKIGFFWCLDRAAWIFYFKCGVFNEIKYFN